MQLFGNNKTAKHSAKHKHVPLSETDNGNIVTDEIVVPARDEDVGQKPAAVKKSKKKKKALKIILIVVLVLAILALGAYLAVEYLLDPPDIGPQTTGSIPIEHVDGRKKGVYTFLVAGIDQISNNTDTIMVGSFDTVNHKINVVSIPRDTLINIKHEVKKANSAYHYAHYYTNIEGSSYYGCDPIASMRQELIYSMLGFDIDSYVLVNLDACEQVVDAIGGVNFNLPIDMNYDSKPQDLHIHLSKGPQTLSGEDFVKVMRFRSAYSGGDLDRIDMQQKLLMALASQMLSLKNIPNLDDAIRIVSENMQTNMTAENMMYFAKEFLKVDKDGIKFMTMPKIKAGSIYGQSYVFVDIDAWLEMVNENLNPWKQDVTPANVNIVTFKDGNFYSTTGELSGGVSSFTKYSADSAMDNAEVIVYQGNDTGEDNANDDT